MLYKLIDLDTNHELTFDDYVHAFTEYKHQLDKKGNTRDNIHKRLVLCAHTSTEIVNKPVQSVLPDYETNRWLVVR